LQKNTGGEKSSERVTLNVKGEEKEKIKKRKIRSMKIGGAHETERYCLEKVYYHGESLFSIDIKREEKY
jgi:hypothetical protein